MTAGRDALRAALAEALPTEVMWLFDGPHEYPTRQERLATVDALLPTVERFAAEQVAAALGEALSIASTRDPLEAVAWMARERARAAAVLAAGDNDRRQG